MTESLRLEVFSPVHRILSEAVSSVYFTGDSGVIGVFPGHAPLVTTLKTGVLVYAQQNTSGFLLIAGGVAEVTGDKVILLVDVAETAEQIDTNRAQNALERANQRLSSSASDESIDKVRALFAQQKAQARLEAAQLYVNRKKSEHH